MRTLALTFAILGATPACAWDTSSLADARFSSDGRYFSFVEYGQSSGRDLAYASMYVIDTVRDAWVSGTPVRVELEDIEASERDALKAIRRKGAGLVSKYDLQTAGKPVLDREGAKRPNPTKESVSTPVPSLGSAKIELHQRLAASAYSCSQDSERPRDFKMVLAGSGQSVVLADYLGKLPRSRGCAQGYQISNVYVHSAGKRRIMAALVGVYTLGWEGYDRRLIAVTKALP